MGLLRHEASTQSSGKPQVHAHVRALGVNSNRMTMVGSPVICAPGKVFLVGEYAVLEEGTAILAAVSRTAVGQYMPDGSAESPVVAEAIRRAIAALGELAAALPTGAAIIDTSEFQEHGRKLGLGSSAAAAVAAVGAVFAYVGLDLVPNLTLIHAVADAAHRASQGGFGSGADVAVAIHGGYLQFFRPRDGVPGLVPLRPPSDLHILVLGTGNPVATTDMIAAVRRFADRMPPLHGWLLDQLRAHADKFAKAFASNDARGSVAAADAYGLTLGELGSSAGVPIVTPEVKEAADMARSLGGTVKPSGAGGGDIAVGFFSSAEAATTFRSRCPAGLSVLDLRLGVAGVHRRLPGGIESWKRD